MREPPPRDRARTASAALAVLAVIAAVGLLLVVVLRDGADDPSAYGPTTSPSRDALSRDDSDGSPSTAPAPTASPTPAPVVLVGAGDIASCSSEGDEATAAVLDTIGGIVFTTGDNAYGDGTPKEFAECYHPSWGRHRDRTYPAPGNHDYETPGASGYFEYFGARAGGPGGYYAYDAGTWRVYSLNSEVLDDEQLAWLRADLAAHPRACVMAYWHAPLFSSGRHGDEPDVRPLWEALEAEGADVVVTGHDHSYERFAPQTAAGAASALGIRQFVVGTGGANLRPFESVQPNSEARNASTHGVLKLTLAPGDYSWEFVPAAGGSFRDSGSDACH